MKKLLFLGAYLVALASAPVKAQTAGADVVVVKVQEAINGSLKITVCRGAGKSEVTDVKAREAVAAGNGAEAVQQVIAKLSQEGYSLKTSYGGGWNYAITNTLVFIKGQ